VALVKNKVGTPPGELGVSKSVEYDTFNLQCSDTVKLGNRKGIQPVKSWLLCWFVCVNHLTGVLHII